MIENLSLFPNVPQFPLNLPLRQKFFKILKKDFKVSPERKDIHESENKWNSLPENGRTRNRSKYDWIGECYDRVSEFLLWSWESWAIKTWTYVIVKSRFIKQITEQMSFDGSVKTIYTKAH